MGDGLHQTAAFAGNDFGRSIHEGREFAEAILDGDIPSPKGLVSREVPGIGNDDRRADQPALAVQFITGNGTARDIGPGPCPWP